LYNGEERTHCLELCDKDGRNAFDTAINALAAAKAASRDAGGGKGKGGAAPKGKR